MPGVVDVHAPRRGTPFQMADLGFQPVVSGADIPGRIEPGLSGRDIAAPGIAVQDGARTVDEGRAEGAAHREEGQVAVGLVDVAVAVA
ncbi:hypothetical protein DSECCO2_581750 [anaerobic digester metagenome]